MVLAPTVLWAQRKDKLFLTIDVQDAHKPTVKVTNDPEKKSGHLAFKGAAASHATGPEPHSYELDLELFGEVDEEESKVSVGQRYITLVIAKKVRGASSGCGDWTDSWEKVQRLQGGKRCPPTLTGRLTPPPDTAHVQLINHQHVCPLLRRTRTARSTGRACSRPRARRPPTSRSTGALCCT